MVLFSFPRELSQAMSANDLEADTSCCALCGIAEVDDIKLKECSDCDLVRYCSDECQREHKSQHEEACKERAAKLRDELLFKQPESSHLDDCLICMIPLQLERHKSTTTSCCSKTICLGCDYANLVREEEASLVTSCLFCRTTFPITDEEEDKLRMKRVEVNDPDALMDQGTDQYSKGDYGGAIEYWTKATELGNVQAHFKLAIVYHCGEGVEKDRVKEIHHLEEAAIGGHPSARYNLGCYEARSGNVDRAVKH